MIGDAQLIDGRFRDHSLHPFSASGRALFTGKKAEIEFANLQSGDGVARIRGEVDLTNSEEISVRLVPNSSLFNVSRSTQQGCVDGVSFSTIGRNDPSHKDHKSSQSNANENIEMFPEISEVVLQHAASKGEWTLTVAETLADGLSNSEREPKTTTVSVAGAIHGGTLCNWMANRPEIISRSRRDHEISNRAIGPFVTMRRVVLCD